MLSMPAPETPPTIDIDLPCTEKNPQCTPLLISSSTPLAAPLTPFELYQLLESDRDVLVIDTRSLEAFLGDQGRIRRHVSFPSLLCKRFAQRIGKCIESFRLEDFITTSLGSRLYSDGDKGLAGRQVVIIDDRMQQRAGTGTGGPGLNPGKVLLSVLDAKKRLGHSDAPGELYFLDRHLGDAAKGEERLRKWVVWGENETESERSHIPPPPLGVNSASSSPLVSMPPSRSEPPAQPMAILSPRQSSISLLRNDPVPTRSSAARASLCKLDTSSSLLAPHSRPGVTSATVISAIPSPVNVRPGDAGLPSRKAAPPRLTLSALKLSGGGDGTVGESINRDVGSPSRKMSVHELCHQQAKSPSATAIRFRESDLASPTSLAPGDPAASDALPPFVPSTIVPNFLYLGPEPTSPADFAQLDALGVTEILNLAVECRPLAETDDARKFVEKYWYLPLRDSIEETGVRQVLDKSCEILDDAALRGRRVYVHCQAGKSRSCTIVLAHLIRARRWPLKKAYTHVAERRDGISPNLGFMAELMSFEERVHSKQSHTVPPSTSIHRSKSVLVQPTGSSTLLLMSPTTPTGSSDPRTTNAANRTKLKLGRGVSDLGPSATAAAALKSSSAGFDASRAVRELLANDDAEAGRNGSATSGSAARTERPKPDTR
ncbi:hypothetical protein JCM11491_004165 [Sporobolomyces phaffii]